MDKQPSENGPRSRVPVSDAEPDSTHAIKFFKALSDRTRRRILLILEEDAHTVGKIVSHFELSQPTISRHLSLLKDANLIVGTRTGQHVTYRLNEGALAHSMVSFFGHFSQCRRHLRHSSGASGRGLQRDE